MAAIEAPTLREQLYVQPRTAAIWKTERGEVNYIGAFDPAHQANIFNFAMRRAPGLEFQYTGQLFGWGLLDGVDFDKEDEARMQDPVGWLLSTPWAWQVGALLIGGGYGWVIQSWENVSTETKRRWRWQRSGKQKLIMPVNEWLPREIEHTYENTKKRIQSHRRGRSMVKRTMPVPPWEEG